MFQLAAISAACAITKIISALLHFYGFTVMYMYLIHRYLPEKQMTARSSLIYSALIAIYCLALVALSYYKIENKTLHFIGEILTIPVLILAAILFVYDLRKWFDEKMSLKSLYLASCILLATIFMVLIFATVHNI